jgi:hypothetical protein
MGFSSVYDLKKSHLEKTGTAHAVRKPARAGRFSIANFDFQNIKINDKKPRPRLALKGFSPGRPAAAPDKSLSEGPVMQDQSASVTSLAAEAHGVGIEVEAQGAYTSDEYPDGFKWTQTIDTNVPLGGTTSPYVDPRPNDDTKPFYYTDAEHIRFPSTFHDHPSRPTPATGTTYWYAILGLNGVNEATKTAVGFDYLQYGFTVDSAGTITVSGPTSGGGANHRSTLSSEFADWTFS